MNEKNTQISNKIPTIYIGYDPREKDYLDVLVYSIQKHASKAINIVPLVQESLRRSGLYFRTHDVENGQKVDMFDKRPFSTEFSFTRFLVPFLNQHSGLALYMDCDMFVRSDITEVFERYGSDKHAISCVQSSYYPNDTTKMDNQVQHVYPRKNWSSFVLWNCSHPAIKELTVHDVNTKSGSWLHAFSWCESEYVGSISEHWNWIDGYTSDKVIPRNVHFTTGGPMFRNWKGKREIDNHYAKEWNELYKEMIENNG